MTDQDEPRCPRCGTPLKIETVRVPKKPETIAHDQEDGTGMESEPQGWEERQEVSDCPRCQGAY